MCRFKYLHWFYSKSYREFQYIICVGSRRVKQRVVKLLHKFQYIICVGSRLNLRLFCVLLSRFNTSYVSVQVEVIAKENNFTLFQYIICVGSSKIWISRLFILFGFNTSYVSVQVLQKFIPIMFQTRFNTSYVSVQAVNIFFKKWQYDVSIHHMCRFKIMQMRSYLGFFRFNTSYVSVQVLCPLLSSDL